MLLRQWMSCRTVKLAQPIKLAAKISLDKTRLCLRKCYRVREISLCVVREELKYIRGCLDIKQKHFLLYHSKALGKFRLNSKHVTNINITLFWYSLYV